MKPCLFISLVAACVLYAGPAARAQDAPHLTKIVPGGMPGFPVFTQIDRGTNSTTVTWDGPAGPYQLFQRGGFKDPSWHAVGSTVGKSGNALASQSVSGTSNITIFRLSGPSPQYGSAQTCAECHTPVLNNVVHTRHFGAFTNASFVALGGQTDPSCFSCHTVGYGLPAGFQSKTTTPQFANVQCESCHGPAGTHAANPEDPATKPRVDLSAAVCGGCHNSQFVPSRVASLHPSRFEEWNSSAHRAVNDTVKSSFASSASSISTCGACHSGTVRESLLEETPLPSAHEAGAVGVTCGVCHDAHQQFVHTNILFGLQTNFLNGVVITNASLGATYTNQIESPLASFTDFHTTGAFATNYNPDINLCAQCHNDRGASSKTTSRPPHHSPQYNMLIGSFRSSDTDVAANHPATHAFLEKQCVSCHMQTSSGTSGHSFKIESYDLCQRCHTSPELLKDFVQDAMKSQIQRTKAALDFWAVMKAPAGLQKYGARAWEYETPGDLSGVGPSPVTSEQSLIPDAIKRARFDLYLVFNEGSFGVHNGTYASALVAAAYNNVLNELNK